MSQPGRYRIRVHGLLDESWSDWFEGMEIAVEGDLTTLTGPVADQAALRGILARLWNLNLTIITVERIAERIDPPTAPDPKAT